MSPQMSHQSRLLGTRHIGLLAAVPAERAGRGKLAELVPDHIFLNKHLQKLVAVVNLKRMAHKLRRDRTRPGPSLDGLLRPILIQLRDLLEKFLVDEWTFFSATAHDSCQLLVASCQ